MNKIFKTFLAASVSLLAVACNLDQINDTYVPEGSEPTMLQSVFNDTEIEASVETIAIPVVRSNSKEEFTVKLTAVLPDGITISGPAEIVPGDDEEAEESTTKTYSTSVTFASGEAQADLILNITAMAVGSTYSGSVSIAEGEPVNENKVTMSTSFKLAKAYTWVSLGVGKFLDCFVGNYNDAEILKAEGFDIYRIVNPFPADILTSPDLGYGDAGEAFGIGGAPCPYIEFWVLEDGVHIAWDEKFSTTIDYSGSGDTVWLYYPGDYNAAQAPKVDKCKFLNDEKTVVQFWGIAYVDGIGGWGDSYAPSLFSFPGGPDPMDYL